MADISKINVSGTTYSLKDNEARAAIAVLQSAIASSLIFKGVVSSATDITSLTNYKMGWTYKATTSFSIPGIGTVENGDMIICIADYFGSFNASDWTVVQNNVDTMTGASSSTGGTRGLVPAPNAGQEGYYLSGDGTWKQPEILWGSF